LKSNEKKKAKSGKKIMIIIILLLLFGVLFLTIERNKTYTITFDTNGGSLITNIEIKNNEVIKLPDNPDKDGFKFAYWTNEDNKIITNGTKVTKNETLKANWISEKSNVVTLNIDIDEEISSFIFEKGAQLKLPVIPKKEGYIFVCWLDENGNLITENKVINNNTTLKAKWIMKNTETIVVTFDTDSKIGNITLEKGNKIVLPENPKKEGYVFTGWVDEKGNKITTDTVIDKNITIKPTWKEPYTCPSGCTPIGNGSKCTKVHTTSAITYTGCPNNAETVETFCSSHKHQVSIGFGEDQTFEDAGVICHGNPTNFCVDYNSRYTHNGNGCPSGYFEYYYSRTGLDAEVGCAKRYEKNGTMCPNGYTKSGDKCTKTETINCTEN